jgi:hypothetical protein
MAITHVKVTYSVQPSTARRVQELATKWGIPKSEVIRRAVERAEPGEFPAAGLTPLQALRKLQKVAGITMSQADKFSREVRVSRRASGRKRG